MMEYPTSWSFRTPGCKMYKFIAHCVLWTFLLLVKYETKAEETQVFSLEEGLPVGTLVGVIGSDCARPEFEIFPLKNGFEEALSVDKYTGEILTKIQLDRESRDQFQFVVVSMNHCPESDGQISVIVNVNDVNDNAPTFPESSKTLSLSESSPRDAKYPLGSATDPDLGINSTQRYEIYSGNTNNTFRLGEKRSPNGILYLDLAINGALDFEVTPSYNLVIRAFDGRGKYGEMKLHVIINDVNDNQPIFNQTRYSARVPENATVATPVAQVYATDQDSGNNGRVEYYIDRQRSDPEEKFDINPNTGVIYVNKDLDYETKSRYDLIVVARDNGSLRSQTTAIVSILVLDVNDNEPTISLIFLTNDGTAKISETAEPGDYVARISVSDPDLTGSYYAHVNVTLDGGDGHFGLTTRDNVVYLVILAKPLDREVRPFYQMTVVATDSGIPPLRAIKQIKIIVTDANDNPPVFLRQEYIADVQEVVPVGSSVMVVSARDSDEGDNSMLIYSLSSPSSGGAHAAWFHIDNRTGLITTRTRLDCESASELSLTVTATDTGVPPLSASATVIIRIQDVNDNQPVFDQSFYNVSVPEDKGVGSCILKVRAQVVKPGEVTSEHILKVSASDPDCGGSTQLTYSIAINLGFDHPRHLEVNEKTGELCITQPLDYETKHTYEFPILARDQDGLDTTTMVKITVRDVNDNAPRFNPAKYNVNLAEDVSAPHDVIIVRATDTDSGRFGDVTYYIVSGNNQNVFDINSQSGQLRLSRPLPAYPRVYKLAVAARDGGGRTSVVNANVTVSVLGADQLPPSFSEQLYTFTVNEDAPSQTAVGQVRAVNTDSAAGAIRYSIVSGDEDGYYTMDARTGQIRTGRRLDYNKQPISLLNIQAESGSPPSYGRAQVKISVRDVNDNAPQFEVASVEIPVKENTAVGTIIYVAQAVDRDGGDNGRVSYMLASGGSHFSIDSTSGAIRLARQLDYETTKRHELAVVARDHATVSQQTRMTLVLAVQDVNDNAPVFRKPSYSVTIIETIPPNTKFLQVNATDADSSNNARISYMLESGPHADKFGIFPDGYLYNRAHLDREQEDEYILHVVAMDSGLPPQSSTTEVRVQVLDANDNSPVFQEEDYVFHVEENQPVDTLVGVVSAIDRDQTDKFNLRYTLSGAEEYFRIKPDNGELLTKRPLDQERQDSYQMTVKVSDGGSPPLTATVNVLVRVLDLNDNTPTFDHQGAYLATVDENQPKGTVVTQVSARDLDKSENGSITYHLAEGSTDLFAIHAKTGQITTREVLDHEKQDEYRFTVVARDGGQPRREATKTVVVSINDINESPPLFEKKEITFVIDENQAPGSIVGNVKANDTDSGENGRIVYYLIEGNLFGIFKLNQTTGSIIISKPVDYEISSSYTLIIRALDNSVVNPLSSSIVVHIRVRDRNDNAPVFEQDPILISVRENSAPGTPVHTFSASDLDSGPRGDIRYSLVSQAPESSSDWFTIDPKTGILQVATPLDYEQVKQVTVQVRAEDQPKGEPSQATTVTALVMVLDANDNRPVFQTRQQVDILEDEPVGYPIEHVLATDADSRENGRVSYAIVSGNEKGHFRLDSSTGLLSIARTLDRESRQVFRLNVTGRDHGYPQMAAFMTLTVNVIDVNDNPPVFQHTMYNATVAENMPIRTFVTKIQATDPDIGQNAQLQYLIPSGVANNHFMIGKTTGNIDTNATLDREQQANWVITAYVKDSAFPALYDTTTVYVTVTDVNDNDPAFKESRYDLVVPENAQTTVIHTVVAMDTDTGDNGRVTYSIIEGNEDNHFILNPTTGELSCLPLDREQGSSYTLTVMAKDGGQPSRTTYATLSITVLDENDNNPIFRQSVYETYIAENATVGTEVVAVTADDADEGINARISYSISNATEGMFKINNNTGMITTAGEFDREKKSTYSFEVDATDGGQYGPRTKKVRVTVHVTDINDNAPVFAQIPYKATISASHGVRQYVVQVVATDRDEGPNAQVIYALGQPSQYFEINRDTGTIVSKTRLDRAVGIHTLEVVASDRAKPPKTARGLVEIKVGNAQGLSSLRFVNLTYNVIVDENSPAGTRLTTVRAEFMNGGSGPITYSFASGNEERTFNINPNSGAITVGDPLHLDYEVNSRMRLIVVATSSSAYGYTTVWVTLRDVNDNAPRFTQERYISSVFEGNKDGTYVTQISAADADAGRNGRVTYSIIGGNIENAFVIDPPNTGIVKTNFILDREIHASYRLEIEAVDGGVPPRTSRCTLKIAVNDVNDNIPFFPSYSIKSLNEGQELGTLVKQVTANDKDLNPVLRYDFTPDGNPGGAFSIDRYSGRITVVKDLDYEERPSYRLHIKATDGAFNATTNLTVQIIDQNDNAPAFSKPEYVVVLPELTEANQPVITVNATDRDAGENARLTYSIFTEKPFRIDPQTGTIYTKEKIMFNPSERTVHLVVKAEDHGYPVLSQVVPVRLQIVDVNNHAPTFDQPSYSANVQENAQQAMTVLTIAASDEDYSHDNSKVDYSIVSGNEQGKFQITSTGELLLVGALDHEQVVVYNLIVMAKDRGEPPLNSTVNVKITVTDVNDNAPVFTPENYSAVVNETAAVGTTVIRVRAVDHDSGDNAVVRYFIASGNDFSNFNIDRNTGAITIRSALDYEKASHHRLVVRAEDSSPGTRQSAFTTVIVNTTDINEYSPRFPVMMYLESVREGQPAGTVVFTAHANDNDGGEFGVVHYSIRNSQDRFVINEMSGVVTTKAVFSYDEAALGNSRSGYRFDIIATDKAGKYDSVQVSVQILPKVESLPQFTKRVYDFVIPGNATAGYEVGRVAAINQDDGQAGQVEYYFKEESEYFTIEQLTGMIIVTRDLQDAKGESRRKRFVMRDDGHPISRSRRALEQDQVDLTVVASSSLPSLKGKTVEAKVALVIDRSCVGCQSAAVRQGDFGGTVLVIVVVFVIVAIIVGIALLIVYLRNRDRKRRPPDSNVYDTSYDASDVYPPPVAPVRDLPPTYNEIQHFPSARHHHHHRAPNGHNHTMTTSEISEQSHSASSGRGSAEDGDDVDEEIRMINETPLSVQAVRMPDSGIQQDRDEEDTVSEHSVQNHHEYLARLGIDSTKLNTKAPPPGYGNKRTPPTKKPPVPPTGSSVESMHQFSDEGGGEGVGLDLPSLVYSKLTEVASEENMAIMDGTRRFRHGETTTDPSHAGSLSSVINSEEEFSGSYNWDYLLDWGPQYQPLAHVFAEIARLKDDSIKPKKQPTQIVPQQPNLMVQRSQAVNKTGPPPLLTNAPPMAVMAQPVLARPAQSGGNSSSSGSSASSSVAVHSSRTTQLTSLPSLPRSPISHESSYTSPALSPSFTPSLSPLATRSPSISPLATQGSSGPNTPHRQRHHQHPHHHHNPHHITLTNTGSSESEQEIRI